MSLMGSYEFYQYVNAEMILEELEQKQALEIQRLYNDIHPTMTTRDSLSIYAVSLNVADHAIWIADLKEKHKQHRQFYINRSQVFRKVLNRLSEEEQALFWDFHNGANKDGLEVAVKLKALLEQEVS